MTRRRAVRRRGFNNASKKARMARALLTVLDESDDAVPAKLEHTHELGLRTPLSGMARQTGHVHTVLSKG